MKSLKSLTFITAHLRACAAMAGSFLLGTHAQAEYVNFEGKLTNPVRTSEDGSRLFAVNNPDGKVSVFSLTSPNNPELIAEIPVGIEPVSVNPRTNDEVWVVNEISDSVSIASVSQGIVTATLQVKDEPMDVVFAGSRAFVSIGGTNEIAVFDVATLSEIARIPLKGLNPRALAVSPDGRKIYVAFALSGNGTTIIPKEKAPDQPEPTAIGVKPPKVALIVTADDPEWADEIPYTMPDNDVAEIDVEMLEVSRYFSRLGTINMGLAVNPVNGDLLVANTEARNLVFHEPELRGYTHINRITSVTIESGESMAIDLNPDIDYAIMPNPEAKANVLAQPTAIAFEANGEHAFVAAFSSDRVAKVNASGEVVERIEIGSGSEPDSRNMRGPRGLALHPGGAYLYVLNRISNTISIVDTATNSVTEELATGSHDPTPEVIRQGRGFLYDARLSGNGTMSCASCHIDAERDQLAWNLGDPGGSLLRLRVTADGRSSFMANAHPMKGPMTTQSLRGLKGQEPLHWRGDRASFKDFNSAFDALMGGTPLSDDDIQAFKDFVETIVFPPNPNRSLDNGLLDKLDEGNPQKGDQAFRTRQFRMVNGVSLTCTGCHDTPSGITANRSLRIGYTSVLDITQPTKIPQLRNLYKKVYFDNAPGAESLSGFGLEHDGTRATFNQAHTGPRFSSIENNLPLKNDLAAFLKSFDTGTHAAVGRAITIDANSLGDMAIVWNVLEEQARLNRIDLVGKINAEDFGGFVYDRQTNLYHPDTSKIENFSRQALETRLGNQGVFMTLMATPVGEGIRLGTDRNGNGVGDHDEIAEYVLGIEEAEAGTVSVDPDRATYAAGTEVTLTATPKEGYQFAGWTAETMGAPETATAFDNLDHPRDEFITPLTKNLKHAQQFVMGGDTMISEVAVEFFRLGTVSGSIGLELWSDTGANQPASKVADIGSIADVSTIPTSDTVYSFPVQITNLDPNGKYWVVQEFSGITSSLTASNAIAWTFSFSTEGTNGAEDSHGFKSQWDSFTDIFPQFSHLMLQMRVQTQGEPSSESLELPNENPLTFTIGADTTVTPKFVQAAGIVLYDNLEKDAFLAGNPGRAVKSDMGGPIAVPEMFFAQPFNTGASDNVTSITFGASRRGLLGGDIQVEIWNYDEANGSPGTSVGSLGTFEVDSLENVDNSGAFLPFVTINGFVGDLQRESQYYVVFRTLEDPFPDFSNDKNWFTATVDPPSEGTHQEVVIIHPQLANGRWTLLSSVGRFSPNYLHAKIVGRTELATLTITPSEQGTATADADMATYPAGMEVTLMATPNEGYQFSRWTIGEEEFTENPLTFTIEADTTVTPEFVQAAEIVHYDTLDHDHSSAGNPGRETKTAVWSTGPEDYGPEGVIESVWDAMPFMTGDTDNVNSLTLSIAGVTLPEGTFEFEIWSADESTRLPNERKGTLGEMPIHSVQSVSNHSSVAFFETRTVSGFVGGLEPNSLHYVVVKAHPQGPFEFAYGTVDAPDEVDLPVDWRFTENAGGTWSAIPGSSNNQYLRARITGISSHTLTITPSDHGTVTVDSDMVTYPAGTEVTLTATPNDGYQFSKWAIGEDEFTDNPLTFTIEADTTAKSIFTPVGAILYDNIPNTLPNFWDGIDAGPPGIAQLQPVHAQPFFTGDNGSIASVSVTMISDNGGGSVDLILADDDNGRPGETIEILGTIDLQSLPEWQSNDAVGTIVTFNTQVSGLRPNSRYFIGFDQANQVDPDGSQERTFYNLFQRNSEGSHGAGVAVVGPFGEWLPLSDFVPNANYMMMRVIEGPAPTDPFIIFTTEDGNVTADPDFDEYPIGSEVTVTATPEPGFEFVKWTYGDQELTTNPAIITVTAGATLTPEFAPMLTEPLTITILPDLSLRWNSRSGRTYEVQSSADLREWITESADIEGTGGALTHSPIMDAGEMYYRVLEN